MANLSTTDPGSDGPPYPTPIQFDYPKAAAAADRLRAAAKVLSSTWNTDKPNGDKALQHWTGPYADTFRTKFGRMASDEQQLYGAMVRWAKLLDDAAALAQRTQQAHNQANRLWAKNV